MIEKYQQDAEHKRLKDGIQQSEEFFRIISGYCPVGIFVTDREGDCIYLNPECQSICDFTVAESLGKSWTHFIHSQERELIFTQWSASIDSGSEFRSEVRFQTPLGITKWVYVRSRPLPNYQGYVSTVEDITERKQAEEALRLSEERFRVTLKSIPLVFAHLDCDLRFTWVANTPPEFPLEAILGKRDDEIFPAEVAAPFISFKRSVLESGVGKRTEFCIDVGNQKRVYDTTVEPLRDATGAIVGLTELALDITEQKLAQKALQESEQRLQLAQRAAKVGAWEWNLLTGKVSWSEGIWELLDITPNSTEPSLQLWLEFVHPGDRERAISSAEAVIAQGEEYYEEFRIIRQDGTVRWMSSKGRVIRNADGQAKQFLGVNIDITEHKLVEEALREKEQRYRTIFNTAVVSIFEEDFSAVKQFIEELKAQGITDIQAYLDEYPDVVQTLTQKVRVIDVNEQTLRLFKAESKEQLLTSLSQIFVPETIPIFKAEILAIAQGQRNFAEEAQLRTLQGDRIDVLFTMSIPDLETSLNSVLVCLTDITERKRFEEERDRRVQQFETLAQNLPDVIARFDRQLRHIYISPVIEKFTGLPAETFIGKTNQELGQFEELCPLWDENLLRVLTTGEESKFEFSFPSPDGIRFYEAQEVPEFGTDGQVESVLAIVRDVTEYKRIEQALRESEAQYRTLVMASSQIVWKASPQGLFTEVQGWEEFTGQPVEELIVQRCKDSIHPDDIELVTQAWWQAIRTKSAYTVEHRIRKYDGTYEHFAVHGVPMLDPEGQVKGWIGMTTNINARKQVESQRDRLLEQEQAARQRAEEANRIKDEFLAVLSHELRTPLNPILGWANLLRSGRLDAAKTTKALETIERNAKLQVQLIDDLLDVSRILQGKLSLSVAPIDLATTIEAAQETVRLAAEAKGVRLQIKLDSHDRLVVGDAGRLQQVVWNLLANAVKFTTTGGSVEVKLKYIDCYAHIIVKDTGKGISPEFLPYVFDYFRQADSTTTRTFGGLGLGLAIVRHLVELHGGTVQAESPGIGQGATFTVRLPLLKAEGRKQEAEAENYINLALSGVKVLVVEDQTDTRDLITFILEQHGAIVTPLASAVAALTALMQLKPDILLSDVGMPDMDGYTLIRQIRALSIEQGGSIPAIALTAYAGEIDQQRALLAGFQRHLCKPVDPTALISAIAQALTCQFASLSKQ